MKNLKEYQQAQDQTTKVMGQNQKLWEKEKAQQQQIVVVRGEIQGFESQITGFTNPPANEQDEQNQNIILSNLRAAEQRCNKLVQEYGQILTQISTSSETYVEKLTAQQHFLATPTGAHGAAGNR